MSHTTEDDETVIYPVLGWRTALGDEVELCLDVDTRLDPPVPGLPLVRLDVTTNIGRVHLRHPGTQDRTRRWPGGRRHR